MIYTVAYEFLRVGKNFWRIRPVQKYPGLNLGAEAGAAGAFVAAAAARSEAAAGAAGEAGAAGAFVAAADAKRISQHTVSSLSPPHVGLGPVFTWCVQKYPGEIYLYPI